MRADGTSWSAEHTGSIHQRRRPGPGARRLQRLDLLAHRSSTACARPSTTSGRWRGASCTAPGHSRRLTSHLTWRRRSVIVVSSMSATSDAMGTQRFHRARPLLAGQHPHAFHPFRRRARRRRRSAGSIARPATTSSACPIISSPVRLPDRRHAGRSAPTASPPSSAPRSMRRRTARARSGTFWPPACPRISRRPARPKPASSLPRGRGRPAPSSASLIRNGRA